MSKNNSTSKSFIILTSITMIEKFLSFVYQAMIAGLLGANKVTDAYFSASEIFTLLDSTLLNAMVIVLLNNYSKKLADGTEEEGNAFLSNMMKFVTPFIMGISIFLVIFASPVSYIIAPGYNDAERTILIKDMRLMAFVPVIISVTDFFLVILRYQKRFAIVGLKSLFISVSGMTFVLIGHFTSVPADNILSCGYIMAYVLFFITAGVSVKGFKLIKFGVPKFTHNEKVFFKMLLPLIISNGIFRVSLMIDRVVCSLLGEGSVSCLTYSHTLYNFIEAIFVTNLSTILLSDFNDLLSKKQIDAAGKKLKTSVYTMVLLLLPISIISFIYRYDIVSIVFERGSFKSSDVDRVSQLLLMYTFSFVPSVISVIYMQVHYAAGKTTVAMKYSIISIGCNIVFSLILTKLIGIGGIAAGTSISVIISMLLYSKSVREIIMEYKGFIDKYSFIKILISGTVCVFIVIFLHKIVTLKLLSFIFAAILGMGAFFISLIVLKEKQVNAIFNRLITYVKR